MVGANAGRQIAVERVAPHQRRMTVDMAALKRFELGHADAVLRQQSREVHELGETDDLRVIAEGKQILDLQFRAGGLQMGCRNAARKLHAHIHDGAFGGIEEEADAG